ncbi:MAG: helix-turn-helix domain-containing protein [Muribaculaceae bacterium]|nr:helix-turn-helix domain-containing protein [Muribaculaceae bacterium]
MDTIKTKIENETQYNWAMARIEELLPEVNDDTPEDDPKSIELYLLSALVEEYEDVYYPIGEPSLIDMIKLRMYEMRLSQATLAKKIGVSPSRICDFLSGKSEPTMKVGRRISKELNIDPSIVLGV